MALKWSISDLDIDEEEVLKLAALGLSTKSFVLLLLQIRSYKELMAKCNILGRGEAWYSKKLEKAKEKITKLKERVQELETLTEAKENEYLRSLKLSKITKTSKNLEEGIKSDSDTFDSLQTFIKRTSNRISTPKSGIELTANDSSKYFQSLKIENSNVTKNKAVNVSNGSKTTFFS
ncbi:hypothetical protein JHK82_017708 [Glycine max]|nr:hypothetical protein JHK82_017708 [Glycine max]